MTDAALFDMDGTLVDSREVLLRAWHVSTEAVLGRRFPSGAAEEKLVFTYGGRTLFPRVAGDRRDELAAAFQAAYAERADDVRAFPGVHDALAALRDEGLAIGVVTSKSRVRFARDLEVTGLGALVDAAACSEDTETHKPDPAPVRFALDALGAEPRGAVMVGDTEVDVAAAAAAGVRSIGVAWGAAGADAMRVAGADSVAEDAAQLVGLVLQRHEHEERVTS